MLPGMRFETKARMAYVFLVVVLVGGTALAVRRATALSASQVARARAAEQQITMVERLRWNSELIVADGRGYLVAAEPRLLAAIHSSEARFETNARALRAAGTTDDDAPVNEALAAAARFRQVQRELLDARKAGPSQALVDRFETELMPLQAVLDAALDRLVAQQERALGAFYQVAEAERRRVALALYAMVGALAVVGLALAFSFATLLGRAYRREHEALATARKALATRDEVMGMVAHDLRNPLGAILLKAELLGADRGEPESTRRHVESIAKAGRRMDKLIRTMLDVATLEAGRFTVTCAACDVDALMRDAADVLAGGGQIRLETRVDAPGVWIWADRDRVLQVLSNLVGNAVKFSPPGGAVTVAVGREGEAACFTVTDEGPGISPDELPHLFERYWKRELGGRKGTGLGLFIAKGIVDAHGGRIRAISEPGRGATFAFTIPIAT